MNTFGGESSAPPATCPSTMNSRTGTPTWIAASPAPLAAIIVSVMSATS